MKISLIIPAYNEEKYIGQCLDAVTKNACESLAEIIVVDNASTDRTSEIAKSFPNVRVVYEEKKGLTKARQCGYNHAQSPIVAYIDADTKMPAQWLERIAQEFENNQKVACVSGPYIYHDIPKWQQFFVKLYWYLLAYPMYLIIGYMVVGGNFAIRKDTLIKMNGFDTTIDFYGEDTNIARRAHAFGKVLFKPSLYMFTSGRRFSGQGFISTGKTYVINFVSEVVLKKPLTKSYKDIR
ncbi:MAG: glycosyltransferase family 2 protein [Patescibacteria group bacterium]